MRGVGIAVALGVFAEEPAAPRRLHERLADRVIVLLARLRGASRDRRQGKCFVGHAKLIAQMLARCVNDHHDIERIAIELMPSESQIPIASQATSRRFATRLALFYGTLFGLVGTHLPFFPVWLKAVGIDASWIGIITAVPAVTRFTALPFDHRPCRTAPGAARRPDRGGVCDRARAGAGRNPAPAARGIPHLRRHVLPVDVDDAADRRLCAARRGALRAELRAAAAVGLGGLRGRRAGLRAAGRPHRRRAADLGDRVGGGARRARQPRAAAAGQSKNSGGARRRQPPRCCAIPASSPSSPRRR